MAPDVRASHNRTVVQVTFVPSVFLGPCAAWVRLGGRMGCCLTGRALYFDPTFRLVTRKTCQTTELCTTKARNGFSNLRMGGFIAYNPWDTLLLALVGRFGQFLFFCAINKTLDAVRAPCEQPVIVPLVGSGWYVLEFVPHTQQQILSPPSAA